MKDDEYKFEELDDPRTWEPDGLVADGDRVVTKRQYWEDFEQLLHCCGQVAYYWKMAKNFVREDNNSAKEVAEKYCHSLQYYRKQKKAWVFEARRALKLWQLDAYSLGAEFHIENDSCFLNSLLDSDRRDCARKTIKYGLAKGLLLSPAEIEARYQARLERRRKRQAKEGPFD